MPLDPRSFIVTTALLAALCAFIFFVLRRSFPPDIRGLAHWGGSCSIMTAAAFLFVSRNTVSVVFSSVLANLLVVAGLLLMYAALKRFTGLDGERRGDRTRFGDCRKFGIALAVMAVALVWLTLVRDDYRGRVLLMAGATMTLCFMCAQVVLVTQRRSFAERFTAGVFLFTAAISFLRFGAAFFQPDYATPLHDVSSIQYVYLITFSISVVALSVGFLLMVNRTLQLRLEHSASHDSLTNAYTRGAFFALLEQEIRRAGRSHRPLSLLMIDLDDFKAINDEYGHPVGDKVILDFVRRTQHVLRSHDSLGRYGGEEFGVILPDTPRDEAYAVANRIRTEFGRPPTDSLPTYTVSVGVTSAVHKSERVDTLLERADQALYRAKRGGKNRVEVLA